MAFDATSVVFHIDDNYTGNIIKVSRAIYHSFGYKASELDNIANI